MTPLEAGLLLCFQWILQEAMCVSQAVGRSMLTGPNTVLGVNSSCSGDTLSVRARLERPFSGMLYARGFPLECRAHGSGDARANLVLPATGCGVRVLATEDGRMAYSVVVQVQMDRYLQQATDQEHTVVCKLPQSARNNRLSPSARTGRRQSAAREGDQRGQRDSGARAWLEISGSRHRDYVTVGEQTKLRVKALLPAGSGLRVTDCVAHDGAGDSSQRLLDDEGCPVDETLLPALSLTSPSLGLLVAQAVFPAFKFPDRDSLHVRCHVQLCRGACPQAQCEDRTVPSTAKLQAGAVVEQLEVFNSVEVLAPGIETYDMSSWDVSEDSELPASERRRDAGRSVCLSPPRMIALLGVLALVLLAGVSAALWTLLHARQPGGIHHRWFLEPRESLLVMDSPLVAPRRTHHPWRVLR